MSIRDSSGESYFDLSLYVRIRGRVKGPFDWQKLCSLAARGELSRIHEVSKDGHTWESAASFPDLFTSTLELPPAETETGNRDQQGEPSEGSRSPEPPDTPTKESAWYYAIGGTASPSVSFATLQQLAATGEIGAKTEVWTETMPDWASAESIPGLIPPQHNTADESIQIQTGETSSQASSKRNRSHSGHIARTLADSRAWVMYIGVVAFVAAALLLGLGIWWIVIGGREHEFTIVAFGLTSFIYVGVLLTGGMYLISYNRSIQRYLSNKTDRQLDSALRKLHSIWVFVGIVLTVFLFNTLIAVIWFFSAVVSLEHWSL